MRLTSKHLGIALLLAAAGVSASSVWRTSDDAETAARNLYLQALTARQRGEAERSNWLLRDAWAADPTQLLPLIEFSRSADEVGLPDALLISMDSIALRHGDSLLVRCTQKLFSATFHRHVLAEVRRSVHPLTRQCAQLMADLDGSAVGGAKLWHRYPDSPWLVGSYLWTLAQRDPARALHVARKIANGNAHPMTRVAAYVSGSTALHKLGAHAQAANWEREGEERARDWGPGALAYFLLSQTNHASILSSIEADDAVSRHAHQAAERAWTEAARLERRVDARTLSRMLFQQGLDLQASGQLREAMANFDRLIPLADSIGNRRLEAYARARRGRTLVKLGRLQEAERELTRARELGEATRAVIVLREVAHDLLHLHEATGAFAAAVRAGHDFARFSDSATSPATRMMAHHDLGWLYRRNGMPAQAEQAFRRMIADIDTLGSLNFWAGEYFEHAGQLERARDYYVRATAEPQDRGRALAGLVRVNEALGDLADARHYARIADRDTGSWHPEYSPVAPGLLARHGERAEAKKQYRLARATAAGRGQTLSLAQLALESAELELQLGDAHSARMLADSAASAAALLGAREIAVRARATSALAALYLGGPREAALVLLDSALRRADAMHIPQLSASMHLLRGDALLRVRRPAPAMRSYERAAEWVDSTAVRIEADFSRAGYRATHNRVSNRALGLLVRDTAYAGRLDQYVWWSARRKAPTARTVGVRATALTRHLASDEAIVDYAILDSTVAALVVTPEASVIADLRIAPDSVRRWIARFRAPIAPRIGSVIDVGHVGFDDATAFRLYQALLAPLLPALSARTRLVIVPDGALHMLPFDALLVSRDPTRRFVLDDFTITYAIGLDALTAGPGNIATAGGVTALAVAGPNQEMAGGSAREVAAVRSALGSGVRVLGSSSATKTRVISDATGARILHFATHAEANDVNPDLARLALAPDSIDDGWLHAFEIRTLRLDGALVVLSACETAAGRLAAGEGTLSLSRAFLQAGAVGTVATLWPVGAPTATLMAEFYRQLAAGSAPAAALRFARLALRASGYEQPFYWAPFVLTTRSP